jgi:hypothetical protein
MLQAAIVSVPGVDPRIAAQAANDAIGITLFHDLEAQLFDGHAYAAQLKKDCEENEQYSLALYIEPEIAEELRGQGAKSADFLDQWLRASLQISFLHVPGGVT